ncbi:MAG: AlpA family phage regulatory protein [Pseudomonas stutzeri]|uniref:helix-turn-helix transcriptional regulator n=1 Tax=Stutzerimonas stutzeri TaxID=316 RepID=UPI0016A39B62|nr:AlpA family phage regulatory protein [Stutzerimonas stutzeri]MDH0120803.1 AlpA family phage regulatory protein [Stutzerimonas stutzeri]NIM30385.1 AlpA family phage regulatory protein [Stutzerimonas stutzeri]NIM53591.1 AlpA family phage regulatory protein [Stutzerimonas stutzeri]NIM85898.1 AlpA family phage regulatory protein [Stutzerimonas stutzeri]NIN80494.1 AlpA family phage regulatory protein [Stutzerimonas stutzeri]
MVALEGYLREEQVLEVTTLSHATLWREIKAGRFPRQVRLSPGRVGWRASELRAWLRDPESWGVAASKEKAA